MRSTIAHGDFTELTYDPTLVWIANPKKIFQDPKNASTNKPFEHSKPHASVVSTPRAVPLGIPASNISSNGSSNNNSFGNPPPLGTSANSLLRGSSVTSFGNLRLFGSSGTSSMPSNYFGNYGEGAGGTISSSIHTSIPSHFGNSNTFQKATYTFSPGLFHHEPSKPLPTVHSHNPFFSYVENPYARYRRGELPEMKWDREGSTQQESPQHAQHAQHAQTQPAEQHAQHVQHANAPEKNMHPPLRMFWLTKARRLHKKYPKDFPVSYNEQNNPDEVSSAVQQFEVDLRLQTHTKERRRRFTFWAAVVEMFFRMFNFGFDFTNFKKDLDKAIADEEHYLEDEFYQLSPTEKIPSPSKEIALVIVLQVLQRFLSDKQNQQQSRPYTGTQPSPMQTNPQQQQQQPSHQQPIFKNPENTFQKPAETNPWSGLLSTFGLDKNKYLNAGLSLVQNLLPQQQTTQTPPSYGHGQQHWQYSQPHMSQSSTPYSYQPSQSTQYTPSYQNHQNQPQQYSSSAQPRTFSSKIPIEDLQKSAREIDDIFDTFRAPIHVPHVPHVFQPQVLQVPQSQMSQMLLPIHQTPPVHAPPMPSPVQCPVQVNIPVTTKTSSPVLSLASVPVLKPIESIPSSTSDFFLPDPPEGEDDWENQENQETHGSETHGSDEDTSSEGIPVV